MRRFLLRLAQVVVFVLAPVWSHAFGFTPGHLYSTNDLASDVVEYDANGVVLDVLNLSVLASDLRGIEFSGSRLLAVSSVSDGIEVLSVDSAGNLMETYALDGTWAAGNASFGKITFGAGGDFFVSTYQGVAKFTEGDTGSGHLFWTNDYVFDMAILPSGNMLIATDYSVIEVTATGSFVREISTAGVHFVDIRGVEYDPTTDSIFVTMLGTSTEPFRIMRLDFASGDLERYSEFVYGDDMFIGTGGRLFVGSRALNPVILDLDLVEQGEFTGDPRMFVTEMAVPEPGTILAMAAGFMGLQLRTKARRRA